MWILMKVDVLVSPQDIKDSSELNWADPQVMLAWFSLETIYILTILSHLNTLKVSMQVDMGAQKIE